jgi:hypothetical protein
MSSFAERIPDATNQARPARILDVVRPTEEKGSLELRIPLEHKSLENVDTRQEKAEAMRALAEVSLARINMIRETFNALDLQKNAKDVSKQINEVRYWIDLLKKEKDFVNEYREQTEEEDIFKEETIRLIASSTYAESVLAHMQSSIAECDRRLREKEQKDDLTQRATEADYAKEVVIADLQSLADEHHRNISESSKKQEEGLESNDPVVTVDAEPLYLDEKDVLDIDEKSNEIKSLAETVMTRMKTIRETYDVAEVHRDDEMISKLDEEMYHWGDLVKEQLDFIKDYRERNKDERAFKNEMIALTASLTYAKSVAERMRLPDGLIVEDTAEQTIKTEAMHRFIDIPANLEESQIKFNIIQRNVPVIERTIEGIKQGASPFSNESNKDFFDQQLIQLTNEYLAFEERLHTLQSNGNETTSVKEEKELIADAMRFIEDLRHRIHQIDFSPKKPQEHIEREIELIHVEKEKLESIEQRLKQALKKNGVEDVDAYLNEQSSGLGTIRRGLIKLFGKSEPIVDQKTLNKLRAEAKQVVTNYLDVAFDEKEKLFPLYQEIRKQNPLLSLKEHCDAHDLWQALKYTIHRTNREIKRMKSDIDSIDQNGEKVSNKKREREAIEEYTKALRELYFKMDKGQTQEIQKYLDEVLEKQDGVADLWIDLSDEDEWAIQERDDIIKKAKEILRIKKKEEMKNNGKKGKR